MGLHESTARLEWDDLRYLLAVGRHGTLSAAARHLGVNHSTVFRRIRLIEERLGVVLFERHRDGYTPTSAGEEAVGLAERLEGEVLQLERRLAGRDTSPSGTVRVTTTDTLLFGVLAPILAAFQSAHPAISLEVIVENRFLNLSKRDADVAIRPSTTPPDTLVGQRISRIATAIYGTEDLLARAASDGDLGNQTWIATDDSLSHLASARWLRAAVRQDRIALQTSSILGMLSAAKAGIGLAALPCFLGDAASCGLRRVRPPLDELSSELWLLTHRDLRHVARIRTFMDFVAIDLHKLSTVFEGQIP